MDYRCPSCNKDVVKRSLGGSIVMRLEIECSHCKSTIRLNVHRAEVFAVAFNFGTIVVLAVLAYWFRSQILVSVVVAAVMLGALVSPLIERIYLRTWPRYASTDSIRDR